MGKYDKRKSHLYISLAPAVNLALKTVSQVWGLGLREAGISYMNFISNDNIIHGPSFIAILSCITIDISLREEDECFVQESPYNSTCFLLR